MAAGSAYVTGLASLSGTLASHSSVVSVTALPGGVAPYTASYNTGYSTGSFANSDTLRQLTTIIQDTRQWFVVWNA